MSDELEALKLEQKKLSRRIGQAKKSGEAVDELMQQIKLLSFQIKQLEKDEKDGPESKPKKKAKLCSKRFDLYPLRYDVTGENTLASQTSDSQSNPSQLSTLDNCPLGKTSTAANAKSPLSDQALVLSLFDGSDQLLAQVQRYVQDHPGSTPYHQPFVAKVIAQCFGHTVKYWVCLAGEQVVGILPLVHIRSRLFGNYAVSMPFFNYGGVLADDVESAKRLLNTAKQWAVDQGISHLSYRYSAAPPFGLTTVSEKVTFYLPLPSDAKVLKQSFKSKLRSQIKKAQSYPHEIKHGGTALIDDFYYVFSINMRDLGTPVYSKSFFVALAQAFGQRLNVTVVYLQGKPVAAAIVIGHKKRLEIPWASTIKRYNPYSVNMLLYWNVMKWAVEQGYESFDFGRCSPDAGTHKFKAQWGAIERPLYWDYQLLTGEQPSLNTKNAKFSLLIRLWRCMPVWLSKWIGPPLVKNLP